MWNQKVSVGLSSDCKNADTESEELSEEVEEEIDEEESSEVEPIEENCDEEEPFEEDPNEEEEEEEEEDSTEEPCEEMVSEEELDEDSSEEEPSEVGQAPDDNDAEVHQLYSTPYNYGKNQVDDSVEGNVQMRNLQSLNSKLKSRDGLPTSDIQHMHKNSATVSENQESGKKRHSRWEKKRCSGWDIKPGVTGKVNGEGDATTKKRKTRWASLVQIDPTFKPPSDFKAPVFSKQLSVPVSQYPGYDFYGLLLGPHGDTQKRIENESGAKIKLQSKDYVGIFRRQESSVADNDCLHVYIEAHTRGSLDAAEAMVRELLFPVDISETHVSCDVCGNASHFTTACPLLASNPGTSTSNHQIDSLTKLENRLFTPSSSDSCKPVKAINDAKILVGCLPPSLDKDKLIELFLPFGQICGASIVMKKSTGLSKCYGFVEYVNAIFAAEAAARMNGYKIEGQVLVVRVHCPSSGSSQPVKKIDEATLYVGHLPHSMDANKLRKLFLPFGKIRKAVLIKDKSTGLSKCYGFVKYVDAFSSFEAVARMNGCKIEGKILTVQIKGQPLNSGTGTSNHPINPLTNLGNDLTTPFNGRQVPSFTIPAGLLSSENCQPVKEVDETTLYIGGLPLSLNEDQLIELFLPFGQICTAAIIKDKSTGLSKGYGFIKYADANFAAEAIARMNGYVIEGKMLAVRVKVRPALTSGTGTSNHTDSVTNLGIKLSVPSTRPLVPSSALSCGGSKPMKEINEAALFVGCLPYSVNEDKLIELFLPFGQICDATVIKDKSTGLSKGYGFIEYVDAIFAAEAVTRMNGYNIEGKTLVVQIKGCPPLTPGTSTTHRTEFLTNIGNKLPIPFSDTQIPRFTIPTMANQALGTLLSESSNPMKERDGAKLFVGYLPDFVDEDKLIELFLPFGQICEAKVIKHESTGLSKGCGYIEYVDARFAAEAVTRMNGYRIGEKTLAVRVAGHRPSTTNINPLPCAHEKFTHLPTYQVPAAIAPLIPGTSTTHRTDSLTNIGNKLPIPFSDTQIRPMKEIDEAQIFVGYLPAFVDEDKLIELFLPFGQICEAKVIRHKSTGLSKGHGFIKYVDASFAAEAVTRMNGYRIEGKTLVVRKLHPVACAGHPPSITNINPVACAHENFTHLPTYPVPAVIAQGIASQVPASATPKNPLPRLSQSFTHLPTYQDHAAIAQWNRSVIPTPITQGNPVSCVPQSFTHLPTYPGSAVIAQGNPALVPVGITQGNPVPFVPQSYTHLPKHTNPTAISQGKPGPIDWPGPPGSMLPEPNATFPQSLHSPASFGSTSRTPALSSLASDGITSSRDLAQFPGYLKSL